MKHKLTKTENYLIIGADDDIKRGWFYCVRTKSIFQDEGKDVHCCIGDIRISAHLPLNNSAYLEGVAVLPPLEDDVEKIAYHWFVTANKKNTIFDLGWVNIFKAGYNKAKETYKYTEEDMLKAFNTGYVNGIAIDEPIHFKDFIQSLNQPKLPIAFECEMLIKVYDTYPQWEKTIHIPKTITNSEGRTEWVGTYVY